ncbi:MAG: ABC transporter permease [Rhodospirillales bacterium]
MTGLAAAVPERRVLVRLADHTPALLGGLILFVTAIACFSAPLVEGLLGIDADAVNLFNRFQPPGDGHPLGTDEIGRDVLVRLLQGGQVSLLVGLSAAFVAALIGTLVGVCAGYFGGWLDSLLMRVTDGVIALPLLPLLIVLAAIDLEKLGIPAEIAGSEQMSLYRIVFIVSIAGWTTVARIVRGTTLSLKQRTFVRAAVSLGAGPGHIILRHLLPNLASPIIVATTLSVGNIILLESVLSFLGLGIQPPVPSWGNLLTNAQELIWQAPMLAVYPGLAIFVTVISFNLLGDGLQDALDPRSTA